MKHGLMIRKIFVICAILAGAAAHVMAADSAVEKAPLTIIPSEGGIYVYVDSLPSAGAAGFLLYRAELPSLDEIAAAMEETVTGELSESATGFQESLEKIREELFGDMSLDEVMIQIDSLGGKSDPESKEKLEKYKAAMEKYFVLSDEAEKNFDSELDEQVRAAEQKMMMKFTELNNSPDLDFKLLTPSPVVPVESEKDAKEVLSAGMEALLAALGFDSAANFILAYVKSPAAFESEVNFSADVNRLLGRLFIDTSGKKDARYAYKVILVDKAGSQAKVLGPVETTNTPRSIAAPEGVSASGAADGISLAWKQPENNRGIAGWVVFRAEAGGEKYQKVSPLVRPVTETHFTDTTAVPGNTYIYRVAAADRTGNLSEYLDTAESRMPAPVGEMIPITPSAVPDGNSIRVSWNTESIQAGTSLNIYRSETPSGASIIMNEEPVPADAGAYTDKSAQPSVTYYYRLAITDKEEADGEKSPAASARIEDKQPPHTPKDLKLSQDESGGNVLRWSPVLDDDLLGYYLYRGQDQSRLERVSNEAIGEETYEIPATKPGDSGTYFYAVSSVDRSMNESPRSEAVELVIKDDVPPKSPMGVSVVTGDGTVKLSWQPNFEGDVESYRLYRRQGESTEYEKAADVPAEDGTGYTDDTVAAGIPANYKITAVDSSGNESGYSDPVEIIPGDSTPPCVPLEFKAALNEKTASLTWEDCGDPDIAGFRILRSTSETGAYSSLTGEGVLPAHDRSYSDPTLSAGAEYWYRVLSVDTSGNESIRSEPAGPVYLEDAE